MVSGLSPTVGSVKKPGTYEKVKVVSGVVGQGGGIIQPTKPADASFTSGGSRSGQGGVVTNTATRTADTNLASVNMVNAVNKTASQNMPTVQQKQASQLNEEKPNFLQTAGSYVYGEKGKEFVNKYVRLPIFGGTGASFGLSEIKTELSESPYMGAKVAGELVPTTPLGIASYGAVPYGISRLPQIGRIAVGVGFTYLGGKTALNPELPPEQRIVGGIVAGLGATGTIIESYPYLSGTFGKITNPIINKNILGKPVEVISNIKSTTGKPFDIALIPEGNAETGNTPAFVSTAYGFTPKYQETNYLGKTGTITTSQASKVVKTEVTELSRELYGSPWDIKTGLAQTRTSRVGVNDLFSSQDSTISFGLNNPQIVFFENAKITIGEPGTFSAKPYVPEPQRYSTELEVTTTSSLYGTKVGTTKIGLAKVNIVSGKLVGAENVIPKGDWIKLPSSSSSSPSGTTSGYSAISSSIGFVSNTLKNFNPQRTVSSSSVSRTTTSTSWIDYSPSTPSRIVSTTSKPSYPSGGSSTPSYPSTSSTPTSGSFDIPIINFGFGGKMTTKLYKGKQPKKYTPSWEAMILGIRGKAPKGIESGARIRPIPSGYSFAGFKGAFKYGVGTMRKLKLAKFRF